MAQLMRVGHSLELGWQINGAKRIYVLMGGYQQYQLLFAYQSELLHGGPHQLK